VTTVLFVKTFDETARHHWDSMEKEWESEKQKILNALVDSAGETVDFIQDSDVCIQLSILIAVSLCVFRSVS
jgi:hypothetical protein